MYFESQVNWSREYSKMQLVLETFRVFFELSYSTYNQQQQVAEWLETFYK